MDDHLKSLVQQLGNAINKSLSDSESIAEVIGEIKKEGYDVFLVLEATIGFNRREHDKPDPLVSETKSGQSEHLSFTAEDHTFLRNLKITVDE